MCCAHAFVRKRCAHAFVRMRWGCVVSVLCAAYVLAVEPRPPRLICADCQRYYSLNGLQVFLLDGQVVTAYTGRAPLWILTVGARNFY